MTVTFAGQSYACEKAVRSGDSATLYLTEGGVMEISGISDWSAFTLQDGGWSSPAVTAQEQLRADVDFLMAMGGFI